MNILLVGYIIFTFLLSIANVVIINKNAYTAELVRYKIIDKTNKYSKLAIILLSLDCLYFIVSIFISLISALTGNIPAFFGFLFIIVIQIAAFIVADYKDKDKSILISSALKKTDTPASVIEFKVDAYLLEQANPEYLVSKNAISLPNIEFVEGSIMPKVYASEPEEMVTAFPLYKGLLGFMSILQDTAVDADAPLLNAYILENITLLSTVMSILKDEKLVESLKTDLGKQELEDLTSKIVKISSDIKAITEYIKKEKITFSNATNTDEVIESLNEIRSMKEFIDLVK